MKPCVCICGDIMPTGARAGPKTPLTPTPTTQTQCAEAATLGMPFEVWKTRMGRFRQESTIEAFKNVYKQGGIGAFWRGTSAKMVESASKVRMWRRCFCCDGTGSIVFCRVVFFGGKRRYELGPTKTTTQGAILLYAKEAIANSMLAAGVGPTLTG